MTESSRKFEPLGATEFAATLNGDNPSAMLQVLRRFTKQVRKERRAALSLLGSHEEGEAYSSSDEVDDEAETNAELNPPPSKRLKKTETWKEDSNAYHVPFVGTAVAKGDISEVVKGEWPTGLIKAYLAKSPLAVELTGDDWIPSSSSTIHKSLLRRKQTRLSRAIYKAYLKVLTELVTAAVPLERFRAVPLERFRDGFSDAESTDGELVDVDANDDTQRNPFLGALLKQRLVGIFHLLVEETDKGHGKPGIYGGCGKLVPLALRFLQNVAQTSITNARLICRFLDEELTDGVMKTLLRPPPPPRRAENSADDEMERKRIPLTKPARVEAIRLASQLLQTGDSAVAAYICTAGSRERKIKPGIAYVAFREGLAKHSQAHGFRELEDPDAYFDALSELLAMGRLLLNDSKMQRAFGSKLLHDIFARDPLSHLCDLSVHAPSLQGEDFIRDVLAGDDIYSNPSKGFSLAAVEARRLLYLLMADKSKSPLLNRRPSHGETHSILHPMLRLFQSNGGGMKVRHFLLYCIQQSPPLFPEFFRVISIPDPGKHFPFMSTLRFLGVLIHQGPSPWVCFGNRELTANTETSTTDLLAVIWPLKLKRQAVTKAMQSENPLVVLECVKFLLGTIERFGTLDESLPDEISSPALQGGVRSEFVSLLPDLQVILAVRSKKDICPDSKGGSMIYFALHLLLERYTLKFPAQVSESSFDWMKLIPQSHEFLKAPSFVQQTMLRCLGSIVRACSCTANSQVDSIHCVLDIMLRTTDAIVHGACFEIAMMLLLPVFEGRTAGSESIEYLRVELTWWLDALTLESVPVFCEILATCGARPLDILGEVGRALKQDPPIQHMDCSILMMAALADSRRDPPFATMVVQVATRLLLFYRDPIPFADFIHSVRSLHGDMGVLSTDHGVLLVQYAHFLVQFRRFTEDALVCLERILSASLGASHIFCRFLAPVADKRDMNPKSLPSAPCDVLAVARFYIHLRVLSESSFESRLGEWFLRRISPALISSCNTHFGLLTSQTIEDLRAVVEGDPVSVIDAMLVSYPERNQRDIFSLSKSKADSLRDPNFRENLLTLPLLYPPPTPGEILKVQLSLLQDRSCDPQIPAKVALALDHCAVYSASTSPIQYDFDVLRNLVQAWWTFSENTTLGNSLFHRVENCLNSVVAAILSNPTIESTYVLTQLTHKKDDAIVDRCLGLDRLTNDAGVLNGRALLLESLLKTDPIRFAPCFLGSFSVQSFLESPFWLGGSLDPAVGSLVDHLVSHKMSENSMASIVNATLARVISALKFDNQGAMKERLDSLDHGVVALANKLVEQNLEQIVTTGLVEAVCIALRSIAEVGLSRNNHVGKICRLGVSILAARDPKSINCLELDRRLRSTLFIVLAERLLLAFKTVAQNQSYINHVETIDFLIALFENRGKFDSAVFAIANRALVQRLFRSALKHGIHDGVGEDTIDLAARSLKFVHLLLLCLAEDKAMLHFSEGSVQPSDVFFMATSHSKFATMMTRGRMGGSNDDDRLALVLLMHTCVELSPGTISVEAHVWKLLCCTSNAGLDELDQAIGRFCSLCNTLAGDATALPFLDENRCVGGEHGPSRKGRRWDWLLDGLDTHRIQETISFFPVGDSFIVSEESQPGDQESRVILRDGQHEHSERGRDSTGSCIRSKQHDVVTSIDDDVRDRKVDLRYSPAFVLPLLLGALHSCTTHDDGHESQRENRPSGISKSDYSLGPLASMAKRMCDKGVPGLCLASLSSNCDMVRGFSVAILGLLLRACDTEEARAISSWRERPQIVMLLSSIQRAVVLEREKLSLNATDIPVLPTLVSTFLARSSLSISKPDDAMYVPLNRYFLKSDAEHGAFQDMSRLPGFVTLYCSAGDDPVQSRKERMWALNHVRDGFLGPSSYRLLASCHAPELLLTSIENIRLTSFSDEMKTAEYVLLLDTIKKFLVIGGLRAASHLIDKIGLLSWLCSLCTARAVTQTFPIDTARVKVLELMEAAMNAVYRNTILQRPTVIDEACKLLLPVIHLSHVTNSDKRRIATVCKATIGTLASISNVLQLFFSVEGSKPAAKHTAGLDLRSTMSFLRRVPSELLQDGISNICYLPYDLEDRESSVDEAGDFCCFVLEWQARTPMSRRDEPLGNILRRIIHIASQFGGDLGNRNLSMVRALLSSRSHYHTTDENGKLWYQCLEVLSPHLAEGTVEAELATDALNRT